VVILRAAGLREAVLRAAVLRALVRRVEVFRAVVLRVPARDDVLRAAAGLREGALRAEVLREAVDFDRDFVTRSGLPLRFVEAILSSSFSLIDLYMLREAPLSLLLLVLPRFAERAAPAAFCCAPDFAGIAFNPFILLTEKRQEGWSVPNPSVLHATTTAGRFVLTLIWPC
jgi:hypothetical protein